MICYDGVYRLRDERRQQSKGMGKWACSWRVRIIDFRLSQPEVRHIKDHAVLATQDAGIYKTNCAENMGMRICRDFGLDPQNIIWTENFPDAPEQLFVAHFTPRYSFGPEVFYHIHWRPILPNELAAIRPFLSSAEIP